MKKWVLAKYLIDAKKCVDNVLFIAQNVKKLRNLSLRDIVDDRQRKFYINLKIVYDNSLNKDDQKQLKVTDEVFRETCMIRNKNYAHKDDMYINPDYDSLNEIADVMKKHIEHCLDLCNKSLPDVITLDFIDYDRDLYRFLNKIDFEKEEELLKAQYPLYGVKPTDEELKNGITKKILYDIEDIKGSNNPNEYGVVIKAGLTVRERLQEMQDGFIKINVLCDQNIWVEPKMEDFLEMKKLIDEHPEGPFLY